MNEIWVYQYHPWVFYYNSTWKKKWIERPAASCCCSTWTGQYVSQTEKRERGPNNFPHREDAHLMDEYLSPVIFSMLHQLIDGCTHSHQLMDAAPSSSLLGAACVSCDVCVTRQFTSMDGWMDGWILDRVDSLLDQTAAAGHRRHSNKLASLPVDHSDAWTSRERERDSQYPTKQLGGATLFLRAAVLHCDMSVHNLIITISYRYEGTLVQHLLNTSMTTKQHRFCMDWESQDICISPAVTVSGDPISWWFHKSQIEFSRQQQHIYLICIALSVILTFKMRFI